MRVAKVKPLTMIKVRCQCTVRRRDSNTAKPPYAAKAAAACPLGLFSCHWGIKWPQGRKQSFSTSVAVKAAPIAKTHIRASRFAPPSKRVTHTAPVNGKMRLWSPKLVSK